MSSPTPDWQAVMDRLGKLEKQNRVLKAVVLVGVVAVIGFPVMFSQRSTRSDPTTPWSIPFTNKWRLNNKCAQLYEQKRRNLGLTDTVAEISAFYSRRLDTCVVATENEVENHFYIADVSENFIRWRTAGPATFGVLLECDQDGVDNAVLSSVEKLRGYVHAVPYQEWVDDFNGGPPRTLKTPSKKFTKDECKRLFERKLAEIR